MTSVCVDLSAYSRSLNESDVEYVQKIDKIFDDILNIPSINQYLFIQDIYSFSKDPSIENNDKYRGWASKHFYNQLKKVLNDGSRYKEEGKRIIFGDVFHIKEPKYKDKNINIVPDFEPNNNKQNGLKLIDKLIILSALNEYLYNSSIFDKSLNCCFGKLDFVCTPMGNSKEVSITGKIKSMDMFPITDKYGKRVLPKNHFSEEYETKKYYIPGITNNLNISFAGTPVVLRNFSEINIRKFESLEIALEQAKTDFKSTLIFGEEINASISEFAELVNSNNHKITLKTAKDSYENGRLESLEKRIADLPDLLYGYLETLHNFTLYVRQNEQAESSEKNDDLSYCCNNYYCSFKNTCKGMIFLLGAECSPESIDTDPNKTMLEKSYMKEDRHRCNGAGGKSDFLLHLKPTLTLQGERGCKNKYWFLSFRIYFDWDEENKMIIIGWIGRHLYQPCWESNPNNCWRCNSCKSGKNKIAALQEAENND